MDKECLTIPEHLQKQFNLLNYSSKKVLSALLTGQKLTAVQLTEITRSPDVRSAIRFIRQTGIVIADYWEYSEYSRHKVYFIHDAQKGGLQ